MNKENFRSLGFTLIELLIVIALLGALAVAMIAAIDPLEQFKRGQDTGVRNTSEEIYNAAIRYYSLKAAFPWATAFTAQLASTRGADFTTMINAGELKPDFVSMAGARLGKVYMTATADSIAVCYQPTSKGLQLDENTKWNNAGVVQTNCKSMAGGTVDCFWCLK